MSQHLGQPLAAVLQQRVGADPSPQLADTLPKVHYPYKLIISCLLITSQLQTGTRLSALRRAVINHRQGRRPD